MQVMAVFSKCCFDTVIKLTKKKCDNCILYARSIYHCFTITPQQVFSVEMLSYRYSRILHIVNITRWNMHAASSCNFTNELLNYDLAIEIKLEKIIVRLC